MKYKLELGQISSKREKWMKVPELKWIDRLTEELQKPIERSFSNREVIVNDIDHTWSADLVDMRFFYRKNNGIKYFDIYCDI